MMISSVSGHSCQGGLSLLQTWIFCNYTVFPDCLWRLLVLLGIIGHVHGLG